ncbi:serine protease inhibitor ecotin [Shewanella litoralis]|uniref:Ecotin n=1 Tax=Shewanella litoralis TaxID=2282700 RepID=A0ABQ2R0G1_9GAMM|nr:serine protease inhibitor ecotin [Shewanella litoralis]GGQ06907.1 ecotin [Shewanella litoralis]
MHTTIRCKPLLMAASLLLASMPLISQATPKTDNDTLNTITVQTSVMSAENYQAQGDTKMYPAPQDNMVQHVLTLPKLNNESEYLIEIQIGQNKLVDCNQMRLMGEIHTLSLEGWGYPYYQVDSIIEGPSTRMMCTEAKKAQFISLNDAITQQYDSRLAKVFYLPKDVQLRYRIWRAASEFTFSGQ